MASGFMEDFDTSAPRFPWPGSNIKLDRYSESIFTVSSFYDFDSVYLDPILRRDEEKPFDEDFPDGGKKAWLSVAGASCCLFCSFGWINCVGIFQDYYQQNQLAAYSASQIAWIPSLQVFFLVFGGLIVGKMLDDYGPVLLLILGTFLHVFGLMLTSVVDSYVSILLSQAVLSSVGASFIFYPAFSCVSTWFLKKRGAAMGLVAIGSSIGGVIFPFILIKGIPTMGFPWAKPAQKKTIRLEGSSKASHRAFIRPIGRGSILLLLILGRTVPNALADKVGHYNVMITMSTFTVILILAVWLPTSGGSASIAFAVFFGISSGSGVSLVPVLCAAVSPIEEIGTRSGTIFMFAAFAALSGSPIGGAIIAQSHGDFKYTKLFAGLACAIGAVLFVAARFAHGGWKAKL
ncbi:putative Riboflavin transporter MCH5 [Seiridium cardinale]|uniref:Riboflavin transporter MCH5 n=1 Tax=Seiridium cardinale TaxID=138064 RepID=A0ABR2Y4P4_9PEZI